MENNIIGFVGVHQYDTILYLARILYHLGRRVLLCDSTIQKTLAMSIPCPKDWFQQKEERFVLVREENEQEYIEYEGIYLSCSKLPDKFPSSFGEFDVILIEFGFDNSIEVINQCSKVFFLVNQYQSTIQGIKPWLHGITVEKYITLKRLYDCKINLAYVLNELREEDAINHCFELYEDLVDQRCGIENQYNQLIKFAKTTKEYQTYLKNVVKLLQPQVTKRELATAYHRAKNGR